MFSKRLVVSVLVTATVAIGGIVTSMMPAAAAEEFKFKSYSSLAACRQAGVHYAKIDAWHSWRCRQPARETWELWYTYA